MLGGNARSSREHIKVTLGATLVDCTSLEDAAAVRAASDILADVDRGPFKRGELTRLAAVLERYGRGDSAEKLRQLEAPN